MTLNFCTLFDKGYLLRGLSLIESLNKNEPNLHIYVLAMDPYTAQVLRSLNNPSLSVIQLEDFENTSLLSVKSSRSRGEYCWTCTPSLIKYCIETFQLDSCTYLDADTYFFASPRVLIEEAKDQNVLITDHFYTPAYDQTITSGKYCVQFMYFKNTVAGMGALNWWTERCIEWCFARHEEGRFGDQKYLDDWTTRFTGVHELQHRGGALAPWNIQQYRVTQDSPLMVRLTKTQKTYEAIFYHFHDLKLYTNGLCDLGRYKLTSDIIQNFYVPYLSSLERNKKVIEASGFESNDYRPQIESGLIYRLKEIKRRIKGIHYVLKINQLLKKS